MHVFPTVSDRRPVGAVVRHRPRFPLSFACIAALPVLIALISARPGRAALPAGWAPNLTTTATWNDNVTNADRSSDKISGLELRASVEVTHRLGFARNDALLFGGGVAAEAWPRFDGLATLALGPRVGWQHKFGLGALAPTFNAEFAGTAVVAHESDRSGLTGGVTLAWRKRLDPSTRVAVTQEWTRHDARAPVFARTGAETALELARDLGESWQLSFAARWRTGDVLSYATPPRTDLVSLARVRVPNATFGRPFVAYSLDARTLTGALALSRALGDASSFTLGFEYRDTTRQPLRYVNHLVSATLARQF